MDLQLPQELYATSDYVFDEYEHDDDVFYREIREQVLQLTVEDEGDDVDDEEVCESKGSNTVAAKQGRNSKCVLLQNRGYYNWPEKNEEDKRAPSWILNLWRNGNGTGVFIPQIVPSRGKTRPRKRKGRKGRSSKKVEEKQDSN